MKKNTELCNKRKKYLQSYLTMTTSIKVIENLIQSLRKEHAEDIVYIENKEQYETVHEQIRNLTESLGTLLEEKQNLCEIILHDIEKMEQETEKNLLILKYINGYTWEQICEIMNYSLRQTYYIHNHALEHFSET